MAAPGRPPAMGPGRRIVFRPDHRSFGKFIRSEQMRRPVVAVAKDIAKLAGQYAPRRDKGKTPDCAAMADRFEVNRKPIQVPYPGGDIMVGERYSNLRVFVEVYNEARSAAPNEFGGKRNARHRMLGRAGAAFGDFKPEGGPQ